MAGVAIVPPPFPSLHGRVGRFFRPSQPKGLTGQRPVRTCRYYLLLTTCTYSSRLYGRFSPYSSRLYGLESSCLYGENRHKLQVLWKTHGRGAEQPQERFLGLRGHRQRSRLPDAILGASTGLCYGASVFLLAFFHPASRVAVAEAFLARRVGVVHLLSQDEEPAQRPQKAPDGTFWSWVRDVVFRHSVVSLPLPQAPARGRATRATSSLTRAPIRRGAGATVRCVAARVRAAALP